MQLFDRPNPYLAMFSVALKNSMAYRADFLMTLASRFVQAGLMVFIWTAIYHFTNTNSILGITLSTVYVYFFLVYAFRSVINMEVPSVVQQDILEGSIAATYTRPIRYPLQVFVNASAGDFISILVAMLPLIVIAFVLYGAPLSVPTIMLMLAELAIGYALVSLIGFMIGMLAVKITYVYGIIEATWSVMLLLGGGILPLSFFPSAVFNILMLTPFPIMLYMPAMTFLGTASVGEIMGSIAVSLAWLAVFFLTSLVAWSRVRKSITSAGG